MCGVECVCVKGSLVLVLVLDWTQCLPQGVCAPPVMLRGRTAGFPKNWVAWIGGYNLHSSPDCGTPTTCRLYPFGTAGCIVWCCRLSSSSVYSPFSDRVGLPPHNTPFPRVLMKSIGAAFYDRIPFLTSTRVVECNIK